MQEIWLACLFLFSPEWACMHRIESHSWCDPICCQAIDATRNNSSCWAHHQVRLSYLSPHHQATNMHARGYSRSAKHAWQLHTWWWSGRVRLTRVHTYVPVNKARSMWLTCITSHRMAGDAWASECIYRRRHGFTHWCKQAIAIRHWCKWVYHVSMVTPAAVCSSICMPASSIFWLTLSWLVNHCHCKATDACTCIAIQKYAF